MSDRLDDLFEREAARIQIPDPDLASTLSLGRRRMIRRRAAAGMVGIAIIAAVALLLPRIDGFGDTQPLPPADIDSSELKDQTLLAIDASGAEWASSTSFVSVSFEPIVTVCFSLPKWATKAVIYDPSGQEIATHPGVSGVREADDAVVSCAMPEKSSLELLVLRPEEHRIEILGSEDRVDATLRVTRSWDRGPPTDKETLAEYQASQAIDRGDFKTAKNLGRDLLRGASTGPEWNTGNAIHYGHLILGHVAIREGDVAEAKRRLLLAGRSPGSPQLNSFGPNMSLARDLLVAGERETVLDYLDLVDEFWELDDDLEVWRSVIEAGGVPDFGANRGYGHLEPESISEVKENS